MCVIFFFFRIFFYLSVPPTVGTHRGTLSQRRRLRTYSILAFQICSGWLTPHRRRTAGFRLSVFAWLLWVERRWTFTGSEERTTPLPPTARKQLKVNIAHTHTFGTFLQRSVRRRVRHPFVSSLGTPRVGVSLARFIAHSRSGDRPFWWGWTLFTFGTPSIQVSYAFAAAGRTPGEPWSTRVPIPTKRCIINK